MLLLLAIAGLGAYVGWTRAARAGGDRLDRLQYAAVHAILFALASFIAMVILTKLVQG
jgi:chromate transport protein ChrA